MTKPPRRARQHPGLSWLIVPALVLACFLSAGYAATNPSDVVPLEAYRSQVGQVVEQIWEIRFKLETEDVTVEEILPLSLQEELYRRLPERRIVQTPTGEVVVRNQPLRETLDALCASEDKAVMREHLRRLEAQLDIIQSYLSASVDGSAANIQEILARDAFQPIKKTKTPLEQLREWFFQLLEKLLPKGSRQSDGGLSTWNQWAQGGIWIGIAALLIAGSLWVVRRLRRQAKSVEEGARIILGEPVALDMDADELLAQARAAAEAGDWRQGVRKIYIALLHDLDKRGIVPLNPAWTNHEYLAAVRAQSSLYPAMRELTDRFDWLWYGQHPGSREDYERCLSRYREAWANVPAAA
ncbi:MAG: DUF4129 domain-containing protein [Chloracidobacterium sp.]